jgi:hypothetical protein
MYKGIIIAALLLLIFLNSATLKESFENMVLSKKVCNDIDGRCYNVSTKFGKETHASEKLAKINKKIIDFLRYLRTKYIWCDYPENVDPYLRNVATRLLTLYSPDSIIENVPVGTVNTSYVEDKGKVFALCLREKRSGKNDFENDDIVFFVTLHELTHIANESWGHDRSFWRDFKVLLHEAEKGGFYHPVNYQNNPGDYCGLHVDYNPYYDSNI